MRLQCAALRWEGTRVCVEARRCLVETITVAAARINGPNTPEMVVFIGIALLIVAIAGMALARRHRQPRA